jgi:hypothetical protein
VDNPVDGPGSVGVAVDRGRGHVRGAVDGARAGHDLLTGYQQVFPRSLWIGGRLVCSERAGGFD